MGCIALSNGGNALVDQRDMESLLQFRWYKHTDGYAVRSEYEIPDGPGTSHERRRHRIIRMHRQIIGPPKGVEIDHANGDRLDNRRSNLRIATSSQNKMNSARRIDNKSGEKGVCWDGRYWRAYIRNSGRQIVLGKFETLKEATSVRRAVERFAFGDFRRSK